MKAILTALFLISLFSAKCQPARKTLEKAYKNNNPKLLKTFFENWRKEIPPVSEQELSKLNNTLKNAYAVFRAFYRPEDISSLGGCEFGNDIYKNADYLLVQNHIFIYKSHGKFQNLPPDPDDYTIKNISKNRKQDSLKAVDTYKTNLIKSILHTKTLTDLSTEDGKEVLIDSIMNFRPGYTGSVKKAIFLNSKYRKILTDFLQNEHSNLGDGGIMNPAQAQGESEKRKKFLERFIKIYYGHWGGYWQLHSYPYCGSITFDKDMQYAKIAFTMVYEGGETVLKKTASGWKIVSSRRTWIE
ncbi:MAG: hypothetical protein V4543_08535 [Bacteroidota bacterium]